MRFDRATRFLTLLAMLALLSAGDTLAAPRRDPHARWFARVDSLYAHQQAPAANALLDSLVASANREANPALEAAARARRASSYVFYQRWDAAREDAERAIALSRAQRDTLTWGRALLAMARAALFREQMAEAERLYRELGRIAPTTGDPRLIGNARLGSAYLELQAGHTSRAAKGYRSAIRLLADGVDVGGELSARVGLARTLWARGDAPAAQAAYRAVIARAIEVGDLRDEADAWNNLAAIEMVAGDPGRASTYLTRAVECNRKLGRPSGAQVQNMALLLVQRGALDLAIELLRGELSASRYAASSPTGFSLRTLLGAAYSYRWQHGEALAMLNDTWARRDSVSATLALESGVQLAGALVRAGRPVRALGVIDSTRTAARGAIDDERGNQLDRYEAQALRALGRTEQALAAARRARAHRDRVTSFPGHRLAMGIELARCFRELGMSDSLRMLLDELRAEHARNRARAGSYEWSSALGANTAPLAILTADAVLGAATAAGGTPAARTFDALQVLRPAVGRHHGPAHVTASALAQGTLHPGEAFVDLYWDRSDSSLVGVYVPARGRPLLWRSRGLDFVPTERASQPPAASDEREVLAAVGRRACEDLFGPALEPLLASRRVLFCPPAWASRIPLGAMLASLRAGPAPDVVLVPSASWLRDVRQHAAPLEPPVRLTYAARTTRLAGELMTGVKDEITWLRQHYRPSGVEHSGDRPLEEVTPWLARGDVLHVAAHSRAAKLDPWGSGLLLGRGDAESAWLTLRQIGQGPRTPPLVVLATCNATVGSNLGNEPVFGIASGFVEAGSRAVLTTLWDADDRTTARFMRHFYESLGKGATTGEAVRQARTAVAAMPATRAPYYWAGFVLLGDPDLRVPLGAPGAVQRP